MVLGVAQWTRKEQLKDHVQEDLVGVKNIVFDILSHERYSIHKFVVH